MREIQGTGVQHGTFWIFPCTTNASLTCARLLFVLTFLDITKGHGYSTKGTRAPIIQHRHYAFFLTYPSSAVIGNRDFFHNGDHLMSTSTQRADIDPTCGNGRSMACRPVGVRTPKRVDLRWMMHQSTRCNRVSAMRLRASTISRLGSQVISYSS